METNETITLTVEQWRVIQAFVQAGFDLFCGKRDVLQPELDILLAHPDVMALLGLPEMHLESDE